jgi:signal transduction histidine kinase
MRARKGAVDPLTGAGAWSETVRAAPWARSPLGAPARWPAELVAAAELTLRHPEPAFVWWGPSRVQVHNAALAPLLDPDRPSLAVDGQEVWQQVSPRVASAAASVLETGEARVLPDVSIATTAGDGPPHERWFAVSLTPLAGQVPGVHGVLRDTTQEVVTSRRLRLLRQLQRADREQLARLLEESPDLSFALVYQPMSSAPLLRLAACSRVPALASWAPATIELGDAAAAHPWPVQETLRLGRPLVVDLARAGLSLPGGVWPEPARAALVVALRCRDGDRAGIAILGLSPRREPDETEVGFLETLADVLAGVASQPPPERQEVAPDPRPTELVARIADDFRAPLALVLGPLEDALADEAQPLAAVQRERLQRALTGAGRALALAEVVARTLGAEQGAERAVFEPTDLARLTEDVAALHRPAFEAARVTLELRTGPLAGSFWVDRALWEQLVSLLLSEALNVTLGGTVSLSLESVEQGVRLTVRDGSRGLPTSELQAAFEPFGAPLRLPARRPELAGRGLPLVRHYARAHGGDAVADGAPGVGSTLHVTIPAGRDHLPPAQVRMTAPPAAPSGAMARVPTPGALRSEPASAAGPRVLVASGDLELSEFVTRLLQARARVQAAHDTASALATAREQPPDLVLVDGRLPGADAVALVRALRADPRTARLPIVVLGWDEERVVFLEAGADDCISRPFSSAELLARASTQLDLGRLREDATRRERAARAEAEAANRAKDEFLAMVSHELRSPLAAILIWTQLMRSERPDAPTDRGLGMIERSARTLTQIIDDLLDVSRIITGKLSLNPHPLDVAAVIDSAISSAKASAEAKNVDVEAEIDRSVKTVFGDPGRLQQVVGNLLSNAIKFTSDGGRIVVRLDAVAGHARIAVSDSGVGISQDFLPYIFERFRQADSTSTRMEKGLGLGLSIARHLVELHGGTIEAESMGEGTGTTFTVMLPLMAEGPGSELRAAESRAPGSRELADTRILLVDDDDDAREALAMLLTQWGADVTSVGSAEHAFARLTEARPHVLISDIAMPGEDGYGLIRRIRTLPPAAGGDVPAAALTAYATSEDRTRALAAGFQDHLAKPVDPDRLLDVVLDLARRARALHPA